MKTSLSVLFICLGSLFAIVLPFIAKLSLFETDDTPPIYHSLQSLDFKYSLIVGLSLSIPLLFELFMRLLLMRKSFRIFVQTIAPNTITILLLAIPDLIFLFYCVRKSADINVFGVAMYARLVLTLCSVLIFINGTGGKIWSSRVILFISVLSSVGRVFGFYRYYFSLNIRYYMAELLPLVLNLITLITFICMTIRWFYHIYQETKTKPLTTDQYMCSVYTFACAMSWLGITVNLLVNKDAVDWTQWDVNALTTHTLLSTMFYIFIIVFEGRAMQREMMQTKASAA